MNKRFRTSKFWAKFALRFIGYWPPYLGTGIKVKSFDKNLNWIKVGMPLRFYNRNIVGVQFGGSLYSMCDPFLMLIAMIQLGEEYIVWDKAAEVKFLKPGRAYVEAHFELNSQDIERLKTELQSQVKIEPKFTIKIKDKSDVVIAEVVKTLYIRKKD